MDDSYIRKSDPIRCYHCNRLFNNWNGLMAHLQNCKHRNLKRYFEVGDYRFILSMNPRRKIVKAMRELQSEHPKNDTLFLGAILFLRNAALINSFEIEELVPTPTEPELAK